jgi:hypothetical protein
MSKTAPTLSMRQTVILTWPYTSPTLTIILDAPVFNNHDTIKISRIARQTRGGELKMFRYSIWPTVERLQLTFDRISQTIAGNLKTFLKSSVGQDIGYLDHESRQWKGFIINPGVSISQEGPGCQYTAAIEFEGALV